jgi:hypothetical protein
MFTPARKKTGGGGIARLRLFMPCKPRKTDRKFNHPSQSITQYFFVVNTFLRTVMPSLSRLAIKTSGLFDTSGCFATHRQSRAHARPSASSVLLISRYQLQQSNIRQYVRSLLADRFSCLFESTVPFLLVCCHLEIWNV